MPDCYYCQVTDERIHALIGYGSHGEYECIPDLFCQECETKITKQKHTLLYRLKILSKIIFIAMGLLVLDDSTSAIDSATEHKIQRAISKAARGRTTFIFSSRCGHAHFRRN